MQQKPFGNGDPGRAAGWLSGASVAAGPAADMGMIQYPEISIGKAIGTWRILPSAKICGICARQTLHAFRITKTAVQRRPAGEANNSGMFIV